MKKSKLFAAAAARAMYAAVNNPDGFTIDALDAGPAPRKGWAVADASTLNSHGFDGLAHVIERAHALGTYVGGWRDPDGKFHWDAVHVLPEVVTEADAKVFGRLHGQRAIYDLSTGREIMI